MNLLNFNNHSSGNSNNCAYFYTSRKYIMDQTLPFKYVSSDEESRSLETGIVNCNIYKYVFLV